MTRQFFEASGPHGHFIEQAQKPYLDMVQVSVREFQVSITFRLVRGCDTEKQQTNILPKIKKHTPPASRGF